MMKQPRPRRRDPRYAGHAGHGRRPQGRQAAAKRKKSRVRQPRQAGRGGAGRRREGPDRQEARAARSVPVPGAGTAAYRPTSTPPTCPRASRSSSAASRAPAQRRRAACLCDLGRVGPWRRCCTSPVPSSSAPTTCARRPGWSAGRITYARRRGDHDVTTRARLGAARPGRRAQPHRPRAPTVRSTTRPPRSRRSPTATPARCCCATPARPPTPGGCRRPRRPAPPGAGRPAHRAHPALHPQLRLGGRARAARRAGAARGPRRRRLGQAGRRLDRPRHRRPSPCWPADVLADAVAAAHEEGARVTAHCFGEESLRDLAAAGTDCVEHACGLEPDTIAALRRAGDRHRADPGQHRHLPADRRAGPGEVPRLLPAHDRPARSGGTRRSRRRTTPASRSTSARMPVARCRTGWSPPRWPTSRTPGSRPPRRCTPPAGGPGRGSAGPGWRRGRRPTWSCTPTTRARTSPPWPPLARRAARPPLA